MHRKDEGKDRLPTDRFCIVTLRLVRIRSVPRRSAVPTSSTSVGHEFGCLQTTSPGGRCDEEAKRRPRGDPSSAQDCYQGDVAMKITTALSLGFLLGTSYLPGAIAQQTTGPPGSPSATITVDGKQLPPLPTKFGGVIKESAKDSEPWWPPRVVPPKGAPNVLLIMTDDQGYGVSGTFGGVIPTPALDRVANAGLRYTQFCSTALCSPTRAALITGRNHHSAGFGVISALSTGFPRYDSIITPDKSTIGTILKGNGYATSCVGKNHNTPGFQYSVAGPFYPVPLGRGFY